MCGIAALSSLMKDPIVASKQLQLGSYKKLAAWTVWEGKEILQRKIINFYIKIHHPFTGKFDQQQLD